MLRLQYNMHQYKFIYFSISFASIFLELFIYILLRPILPFVKNLVQYENK